MATPQARIGIDYSALKAAPAVARGYAQATAREISNAFKQVQAEQAAAERQRSAGMQASLTQRRVAIRAAAREEVETQRAAQREIAAVERQRTAELKAALQQRRVAVKAAAREEAEAQRAAARAASGGGALGAIGRGLSSTAGAFGIGLGVAGAVQAGRALVESTQLATAYGRQEIAARNLAGSQGKLNQLLAAYERASGGAIDKATALADVTRLQATGFGKTAVELERFVRGARGASIAMGKPQDYIIQEVQLAISNTSFRRLDQIGLGIAEVNTRMDELRATNSGMTREMAFSEAVLGLLNDKFGALTKNAEGQATGVERLAAAWKDLRLEVGQEIKPDVDQATSDFADLLEWINKVREANAAWHSENQVRRMVEEGSAVGLPSLTPSAANRSGNTPFTPAVPRGRFEGEQGQDQLAAINERHRSLLAIDASYSQQILAQTTQYNAQRASAIASYEKGIAREAEDFGRQRAEAVRKLEFTILDIHQDSARQRVKWAEEVERTIAQAQADSAERVAEFRQDSAERLVESEEKYAKYREKRQRDSFKTLREAAANLDAVAVREEQRRFREEAKEAKEAHEEQKKEIADTLNERIDDEAKSLAKSERQAREANARRVEEQAENDKLRIEEMRANFEQQKIEEDAERAIMIGRRAEDHTDQLIAMDAAHAERIKQIGVHAGAERDQLNEEFKATMDALGIRSSAYEARLAHNEKLAIESFDKFMGHVITSLGGTADQTTPRTLPGGPIKAYAHGGPVTSDGLAYLHRNEYVLPASAPMMAANHTSNSRNVTIAPNAIVIYASPGMDEEALGGVVLGKLADFFEEYQ